MFNLYLSFTENMRFCFAISGTRTILCHIYVHVYIYILFVCVFCFNHIILIYSCILLFYYQHSILVSLLLLG